MLRCQQQVDVIGHQRERMDRTAELARQVFEIAQISRVVFARVETRRAVISALDDVHGHTGQCDAWTTRHVDESWPDKLQ